MGLILGLECTLNPFMTVPAYREIADLPLAERVALLHDPEVRSRVLQSADERSRDKLGGSLIGRFDLLFEMLDEPDYDRSSPIRSAPAPPAAASRPKNSHST